MTTDITTMAKKLKSFQMKKEQRIQAIIYIIENSSSYTCGNVRWKREDKGISIFMNREDEGVFYGGTSLLAEFTSFDGYIRSRDNIISLFIY
jgi:hypothetical protein